MSHYISEDAVAFGAGDPTVTNGFEAYKSPDFDKLKKYFYAVMMHGEKASASVTGSWDPYEFAPVLKKYHENYGKGRAILLISCQVGWAFASPLSRAAQLPIVAGLSNVSFTLEFKNGTSKRHLQALDKKGLELQDKLKGGNSASGKFRAEWVFYHPSGQREVLPGGNFLNQDEAILRAKQYVKV